MAKIRVMCTDPYATDCSSDDDESIEDEKHTNGGLFVQEISASIPTFPSDSTIHLDSLAKLKPDPSFRVEKSSSLEDVPRNCIILAMPALKPEDIRAKKSGISSIQDILKRSSRSEKCEPHTTKSSSGEDGSANAIRTCVNQAIDTTVSESRRSCRASNHPGLRITSSGKWGVKIRHPIRKKQIWLGTFESFEEATRIYNKKKLEYASLRCAIVKNKPHQCQPDTTKTSSGEDGSADASQICVNQAIDTTVSESRRSRRASNHPGIKITSSGKWGVQIRHPIRKKQIWLGSFDSFEEAVRMYDKRKLEYASLRSATVKNKTHHMLKAKQNKTHQMAKAKQNAKLNRQTLVVEGISVCQTLSGKWGARIRDPVSKRKLWLGSYPTPEGAVESYNRKKLEFDSIDDHHSMAKGKRSSIVQDVASLGAAEIVSSTATESNKFDRPGVKLNTTGKWVATIQHPIRKCKLWLGSFDDPREAVQVYDEKKVELDALLHNVKIACSKLDTANQESCFLQKETSANFASSAAVESEGLVAKKYKGVKQTKKGQWTSQINDPYNSWRKVFLGTFNTAEAAANAFKRKRHEFDVMVLLEKKEKQERDAPAPKRKKLNADSKSKKVETSHPIQKAKHSSIVQDNASLEAAEIASSTATESNIFDRPGVKRSSTGEWEVTIRHPIRKCKLFLGLFDDPQEAAEVYDEKNVELDTLLHNVEVALSKSDAANQESCFVQKESSADVASPTAVDNEGPSVKKYKGVKLTKSGRWISQINDPYNSKMKVYLGTFDTAEEAADAFKRKRREFDVMVSLDKKRKQKRDAPTPKRKKLKANSNSKKAVIVEDAVKALPPSHNQQPKVEACELIQTGLNNASPSFASTVTIVNSQDSEGSNNNKKQTPRFSLASEHLVAGIINGYGQLIGEYSRLDDELWLSRPGDDDECDLVGGVDHKPSPFLPD